MQIFRLTAQYDLNIMQKQQTLSSITTRALLGMEQALQEAQPDLVLVHGDTSTTFAGALAAFIKRSRSAMSRRACGPMTSIPPSRRR